MENCLKCWKPTEDTVRGESGLTAPVCADCMDAYSRRESCGVAPTAMFDRATSAYPVGGGARCA